MSALTCPKCHGDMRQYERSGVHVDQCTECRGVFLDRGELEGLVDAELRWAARPLPPFRRPGATGCSRRSAPAGLPAALPAPAAALPGSAAGIPPAAAVRQASEEEEELSRGHLRLSNDLGGLGVTMLG